MVALHPNFSEAANASAPPAEEPEGPAGHMEEVGQLVGYVLFSVIFALGSVLNAAVIYIVMRCPGMRTPCNYFLMNIATADLCVAFVCSPLRIVEIFTSHRWVLGQIMCYVLAPVQDMFVSVSAVTYVALTVERYRVIVTPFKEKMTLTVVVVICGVTWLVCYLAASLPMAVILRYEEDEEGFIECFPDFSAVYQQVFYVHLMLWFIVLPAMIQAWAYYRILKSLRAASRVTSSHQGNETRARKKLRLVRTLVLTAVIFQVCLIPRGVQMLLLAFGPLQDTPSLASYVISWLIMVLYYVKHVSNPIVLLSRSAEFRNQFVSLFRSSN